jgi:hypothetical protein
MHHRGVIVLLLLRYCTSSGGKRKDKLASHTFLLAELFGFFIGRWSGCRRYEEELL